MGAAAVINRHFQNGGTTCRQLSKRLPNNSTIFAAEATAITLVLDYYWYMDPVKHDAVVYPDSMSCLQAIEGEDNENHLICHIMKLLWVLSDKGTRVRFCWVPSHCGIEGNEIVNQLAKEPLDHDIDPLATVHYADLKPVVNSYIQPDLYLLKPTLLPTATVAATTMIMQTTLLLQKTLIMIMIITIIMMMIIITLIMMMVIMATRMHPLCRN